MMNRQINHIPENSKLIFKSILNNNNILNNSLDNPLNNNNSLGSPLSNSDNTKKLKCVDCKSIDKRKDTYRRCKNCKLPFCKEHLFDICTKCKNEKFN